MVLIVINTGKGGLQLPRQYKPETRAVIDPLTSRQPGQGQQSSNYP